MPDTERYVPAAGREFLTGLYDPAIALTMRERALRPALVRASLHQRPGVLLDVGCGTGTLAAALAGTDRSLRVLGIDGDEQVLARARAKNARFAGRVNFTRGLADELPVEDAAVDAVIACLLLHHLGLDAKLRALREARRVLRPEGRLILADWGRPRDPLMRVAFFALQLIDGFENTREHAAGQMPSLVAQAGFETPRVAGSWRTLWGTLEILTATPAPGGTTISVTPRVLDET